MIDLPAQSVATLLREGREGELRRREQIGLIRKRLREVDAAAQARTRAHDARALYADAFGDASEAAHRAGEKLQAGAAEALTAWRLYGGAARAVRIPDFEELLDALEIWQQTLSGMNPMRVALDRARQLLETEFATHEAELADERRRLTLEQSEHQAERSRLEAGEGPAPPVPHTRDANARSQAPGHPCGNSSISQPARRLPFGQDWRRLWRPAASSMPGCFPKAPWSTRGRMMSC